MVLSKPHGYYSLIIVGREPRHNMTILMPSAVRHSDAGKGRIRDMCGHPTVGGEQPLRSHANYGSHGKCYARRKGGGSKCRLYQLSNEASRLQHAWDNDDGIARSQDATRLPSRSPNWCLSCVVWHLLVHVVPRCKMHLFLPYQTFFHSMGSSATRAPDSMRNDSV
jgi:hypothetical protein